MLRNLYPTTTGSTVSSGPQFCPTKRSIAEKQQLKIPAMKGGKPCSLVPHLLPRTTTVIPKGEQLLECNKSVLIRLRNLLASKTTC